ncbi:MAG: antitoxin VbhA family protein [Syntrophomonadaceae bacterium]|nr:antitoxin VbhA family protein [Syntrophomonadaceae bacterium]
MNKKHCEVERVIANVQASMAVEGMKPSAKARAIGKQYLEGKISGKEAVTKIKMQHAANFGK